MTSSPANMTDTPKWTGDDQMDALSDVLRVTRVTGGVFLKAQLFEPWCMAGQLAPEYCGPYIGPTSHLIMYHYVLEGQMNIRVAGKDEIISVTAGDVILFPRNDCFHLVHHLFPQVPARHLESVHTELSSDPVYQSQELAVRPAHQVVAGLLVNTP
jgi:hypothetical protein